MMFQFYSDQENSNAIFYQRKFLYFHSPDPRTQVSDSSEVTKMYLNNINDEQVLMSFPILYFLGHF